MTETLSLLSKHTVSMLALGWSKNDHQTVFDQFMNEIWELCKPKLHYGIVTNLSWWISFELYFYLADRPECDAWLNLHGHGGTTSIWFGHVATFKPNTLPSWDLCFKSRVWHSQAGQAMCHCNNCTGCELVYIWSFQSNYILSATSWSSKHANV